MTEQDAKQKWCPLTREVMYYNPQALVGNRDHTGSAFPVCIGSACMAWRWEVSPGSIGDRMNHGYCGNFGKP